MQETRETERQISPYREHSAPPMLQVGLSLQFENITSNAFCLFFSFIYAIFNFKQNQLTHFPYLCKRALSLIYSPHPLP